ncbi:junctional cadherin 5-associated protein [Dasypus novemcinctus]|uniref:junctional cadherin 5-associated protein n=1 Tax=Dasypus novemcinctus TaxID=9361 RepID=UPI000328D757|nr:junctional cadherin 5-associated protein [Dasypus novemcinctus]XP_004455878.1 junctional cadherin 5-associated protein [Dasypus novemcinctus]
MYSVEDLLISHGYKVSRNLPAPREDEEPRRGLTRTGAGQGVLNGYENSPAALAPGKTSLGPGYAGQPESRRGTPGGHRELQSSSASRTSETGFYDQPPFPWLSQPQPGDDRASRRRRGQEPGGVLGPGARAGLEVRGLAPAPGLPAHLRAGAREVGARTENAAGKAVLEEELRMAGPARWQNLSFEGWNQPRKLGRQMSEGDGERLFQDLYPFLQGEHVLTPHNKGKSQSLPRVLSPEGLSCVEMPTPLNDGHLHSVPKVPFYPPNCAPSFEPTRNPEKGGSCVPLPRPKFGRPLKPPSYESHRQARGSLESCERQESQHADPHAAHLAGASEPRPDLWGPDAGLEPPVYVPPPSYRSPPEPITNPYAEDTAPRQPPPVERTSAGHQGAGNEHGTRRLSPQGPPTPPRPAPARDISVQYISFDDPRIRHIQLAQPQGFWEGAKLQRRSPAPPEPAACGHGQHDGAFRGDARGQVPASGSRGAPGVSDPSPAWLRGHLLRDGDNEENGAVREAQAEVRGSRHGHPEGPGSCPSPRGEGPRETITKLKMFETGSQIKRRSKKQANETIFCLVSIPVKSEPHLPDTDRNNNDLKRSADRKNGLDKSAALQAQSFLSMSSTDLELQALTGSMAGKAEAQTPHPREPADKERNDLRYVPPPGHRGLKPSGSWPGHQHRDQQTQTIFAEEPRSSRPLPGLPVGGPDDAGPTPRHSEPTAPGTHSAPASAPGDPERRPGTHHLKGQMHLSLSSNSAFSRTSSCTDRAAPRECPGQPHGQAAGPTPTGEVVKGDAASPCNSKQFFGQFLLKPVSRRPWDLISQLESFNKELQEEEESSSGSSSSDEREAGRQQENDTDGRAEDSGLGVNGRETRVEQGHSTEVPGEPGFRSGRVKSKSESWSEEWKLGRPWALPGSPGPRRAEGSRGGCSGSAEESWIPGKRGQEGESSTDPLAGSPGPGKRVTSCRRSDTEPAPPTAPKEPQGGPNLSSVLSPVKLSQGPSPQVDAGEEWGAGVPLSLANRGRGLSAPDLRAVGLHAGPMPSAGEPDGPSEKARATDVPPHESLQARAARILGIDVAVESLLPGSSRGGCQKHPAPSEGAPWPAPTGEKPPPGTALRGEPAGPRDAFHSRRKCGWTESPLFVGGRDHAGEPAGVDEPRPSPPEAAGSATPLGSMPPRTPEGSPSAVGSEKRPKGTSRVIESLQEKLASPPRRADPGRLMRMKEVSSVSRMRLLVSRGAEAADEARGLGAQAACGPPSGGDPAPRAGRLDSVPKGCFSWEENRRPAPHGERKRVDEGFWCPDSYDPSRVERV